jgi:ribulose-5-phosphate 4-epimerase/fuculose-1-phosphate aldolase
MGDKPCVILRNHGLLTVGRSAAECFNLMFYLSLACEVQVSAQSTGAELVLPPEAVAAKVGQQAQQMNVADDDLALEWAAHLRLLDRIAPDYRT